MVAPLIRDLIRDLIRENTQSDDLLRSAGAVIWTILILFYLI